MIDVKSSDLHKFFESIAEQTGGPTFEEAETKFEFTTNDVYFSFIILPSKDSVLLTLKYQDQATYSLHLKDVERVYFKHQFTDSNNLAIRTRNSGFIRLKLTRFTEPYLTIEHE